jgi:chromosome segregation ATPase
MTQTQELQDRISDLESKTVAKADEIRSLEEEAAEAYATGKDASSVLKKIATTRDDFNAMRTALVNLDNRIVEVSKKEHAEKVKQLQDEGTKRYEAILSRLSKQIGKVGAAVGQELPAASITALESAMNAAVEDTVWNAVSADMSGRIASEVPAVVSSAPVRDADGRRI